MVIPNKVHPYGLSHRAYGREVKAAGCKPVGASPSVGANPTVPIRWGMMSLLTSLLKFFKELLGKTIGDEDSNPIDACKQENFIKSSNREITTLPKGDVGERVKIKWKEELYDFFIVYQLAAKNYDPNGLTEKLTIA